MTRTSDDRRRFALHGHAIALAIACCSSACADKVQPPPPEKHLAPPDQADSAELLEATEEAFGLPLPEGFRVTRRTMTNVMAVGTAPADRTAQYIRDRVDADVQVGPSKTSFLRTHVKVPRKPYAVNLSIYVVTRGATTVIEFWTEPLQHAVPSGAPPAFEVEDEPESPPSAAPPR